MLMTNRKSHTILRLVPKSMTLNDHERHNGRYFALFNQIFLYDVPVKQSLGLRRFLATFTFAICCRPSQISNISPL